MATFIVVHRKQPGDTEGVAKVIQFTPAPGTAREQGIAAIKEAFGENTTGTFYYAPASSFGTIVAAKTETIDYT